MLLSDFVLLTAAIFVLGLSVFEAVYISIFFCIAECKRENCPPILWITFPWRHLNCSSKILSAVAALLLIASYAWLFAAFFVAGFIRRNFWA